jgi:N-acetylgalactosamine kinase
MMLCKHLEDQQSDHYTLTGDNSTRTTSATQGWRAVRVLQQVEAGLLRHASEAEAQQHQCQEALSHVAAKLKSMVQHLLPYPSYTLQQVCEVLDASADELLSLLPAALQQSAIGSSTFHLQQRAAHVFTESHRVMDFKSVCCDAGLDPDEKLAQLGSLMDASHASCAGLYQCSCEELDNLVNVAKEAGALGARLTGAGWGGCTVSLVREEDAPKFIATVREQYFMPLVSKGVLKQEELSLCLFASKPSSGAAVMKVKLADEPLAVEAQPTPVAAGAGEPADYEI